MHEFPNVCTHMPAIASKRTHLYMQTIAKQLQKLVRTRTHLHIFARICHICTHLLAHIRTNARICARDRMREHTIARFAKTHIITHTHTRINTLAHIRMHLQAFAHACPPLHANTSTCAHLHAFARICKQLLTFAQSCTGSHAQLSTHVHVCKHLHALAYMCMHLRVLSIRPYLYVIVKTCVNLRALAHTHTFASICTLL